MADKKWGYRLSGPPSLECEPSGLWSGPVPRCRGKQHHFPSICLIFDFDFPFVKRIHVKHIHSAWQI